MNILHNPIEALDPYHNPKYTYIPRAGRVKLKLN